MSHLLTDMPNPSFEASISVELVQLLLGRDPLSEDAGNAAPEDEVEDVAASGMDAREGMITQQRQPYAPEGATDGFCKQVLRQDGARPLVLNAMLVWQGSWEVPTQAVPDASLSRHISIYITKDRQVATHLCFEPSASMTARPVHSAALLSNEFEFADFVRRCSPEGCFGGAPDTASARMEICAGLAIDSSDGSLGPLILA